MKSRFALTLLVLIPLLAACNAQTDAPATATAPVAEPAAAPAEAAPQGNVPADSSAGVDLSPVAATAPTGPAPVAGTDYVVIPNGQPYAPLNGKVEVVEVFGFTCPLWAEFEPLITAWKF